MIQFRTLILLNAIKFQPPTDPDSKFMDIKRTVLFAGLAIVSYLMVLDWNEDYHQPVPVAQTSEPVDFSAAGNNDAMTLPEASGTNTDRSDEFTTPEGEPSLDDTNRTGNVSNQYVHVVTDVFDITIDRVSGNLVSSSLLQYDRELNSDEPLKLLSSTQNRIYVLESGLIGRDGPDNSRNGNAPIYSSAQANYQMMDSENRLAVDLNYTTDSDVNIIKRFTFNRDDYQIDIRYLIDNQSNSEWQANFTGKIVRDQAGDQTSQNSMGIKAFLGLVISTPEDPYEKYDFDDLKDEPINQSVTNGWMAFLQHYFLTAWIPEPDQQSQFQTTRRGALTVMGFVYPATNVPAGETVEVGASAYVGPKIIDRLEAVAPNLDRTVDFGWLFFISLPLFVVLNWFHGIIGNWGVSIILLTVLVKGLFFHLSATSYRSMARMRAVAPKLARMKELHGDDRQRMSTEMMALYKREKINPLGGCLPILVQMPVFISLYWVLFESVQLRHAPFALWIHDLSVMDPYFILPIIMGASMMLQMHLNPTPPDPMQAKIMKLMPVVFTIFFLWFPAGLVLYWVVNNILSISQQWYITRKIEAQMAEKKH